MEWNSDFSTDLEFAKQAEKYTKIELKKKYALLCNADYEVFNPTSTDYVNVQFDKIFKLEEHTSRFFHSAKRMGFEIPYSENDINESSRKIVLAQNVKNGYVRPVAWRGSEMMAISAQRNKIHVAIAAWEWGSYFDPKLKLNGIKLNIYPLQLGLQ